MKNDNILFLYVFFRYSDSILEKFTIDTIVRAKVHLNFRGVNFDSKAALEQFACPSEVKRQKLQPHRDRPRSIDSDFEMVVSHFPNMRTNADACQ